MASSLDLTKPAFIAATSIPAFLSGLIASISLVGIPSILLNGSPKNLLSQWLNIYKIGIRTAPPLAIASLLSALGSAYVNRSPAAPAFDSSIKILRSFSRQTALFLSAGLLTASIVPFTRVLLAPTNEELMRREGMEEGKADKVIEQGEEGADGVRGRETRDLIRNWGDLNLLRAILPAAGSLVAFNAL